MRGLFTHWREGALTRPLLLDYVGPDVAAKYISGAAPPSGGTGSPLHTTVVGRFVQPSSSSTSSCSTSHSQTPLLKWSPRGHGGTHGGVALWRDDCCFLWFTWFFDVSAMCASWRIWLFDGFSKSARRTTRLSNGCSEKCPPHLFNVWVFFHC